MTTVDKFRNGDEVEFYGQKMVVDLTSYPDFANQGWLPLTEAGEDGEGFIHLAWPDSKRVVFSERFVDGELYLSANGHVYLWDGSERPWRIPGHAGRTSSFTADHPPRPMVHLVREDGR